MSIILFDTTATLYLLSTLVYAAYLITHRPRVADIGRWTLYAAFAFHTAVLISRMALAGRFPGASFHETLTLFAWLVIGLYIIAYLKYGLTALGAFVTPFALVLLVTASFLPREIAPLAPALESYLLPFHITIAFLGNAFFAVACFMSAMYLIQHRYLKSRKLGGVYFLLPSLEVLDEIGYRFITYGFTLLTLAMITGAIWSEHATGSFWQWKHRQVFSLIVWFLYAALLHGRLTSGWRGRKAAVLSCAAFAVVVSSYVIINILAGGAHGYLR
jgi:cytochrome c-type biogenesis protein CcsB